MIKPEIEDQLHLIQGVDMKVDLLSVECLNINTNSNYVNNLKYPELEKEGTVVTVSSKIVLGYEVGFNISLFLDYVFTQTALPVVTTKGLIDIISSGDFKLSRSKTAASPLLHLFELKNPQIIAALKKIYPNIRDLACRDNFAWVANERKADLLIREYELALVLNPFNKDCCFEESLRVEMHESIVSNAVRLFE